MLEFDYIKKRSTKGAKKQVRELFDSDEEPTTSGIRSRPTVNKQSKKRQQLQENSVDSDEEVKSSPTVNKQSKKRQQLQENSVESDEEVTPKKSKQAKPRSQSNKSAAPGKIGWLDSDSEDEAFAQTVKNPQTLQSALTRRVADGVVRRTANLGGDVFVELKVYNAADIQLVDPKDRWEYAVLALKFRADGDAPELQSLKNFIKKCKTHFNNEGKFFSNKKI